MKNKIKYLCIGLLLFAVGFAIFSVKAESPVEPKTAVINDIKAVNSLAGTECYGTFTLNGTSGVLISSACDKGYKMVTLTKKGFGVSSGQLSFVEYFGAFLVYSTDANDTGQVIFKIEK